MKFGNWLNSRLFAEWKFYYIDYDHLKAILKDAVAKKGDLDQYDEQVFVESLDKELKKINDFKDLKRGELERRVIYYEEVLATLDLLSLDEKAIARMKAEIEKITFELGQLGAFTRMNYTGVLKILKKHDKHTKYLLKPTYMVKFNIDPIQVSNLDELVYRLSKLYSMLSMPSSSTDLTSDQGAPRQASSQEFVRRTTKYWVHPDNVVDVKLIIMKNLPVLVYQGKKGEYDPSDSAISSVYLDNENLELYHGRLEKTEGAEAIRLRWYGGEAPKEVFVERKVHREDWTGEVSVKSRFLLKEKNVKKYIDGKFDIDGLVNKLRPEMNEEELNNLKTLAEQVQETIQTKKLHPVLRTFYHRTAFQLPGDATVRISLDTELCMIKEQGLSSDTQWRRTDVTSEFPFPSLSEVNGEIVRFPYAILEVKLQTHHDSTPPNWVMDLVKGPLVEEVPKFSKFVHGCAVLFEKSVSLFPFWLSQMNVDIRKGNGDASMTVPRQFPWMSPIPTTGNRGNEWGSKLVQAKDQNLDQSNSSKTLTIDTSKKKDSSNEHIIDISDLRAGKSNVCPPKLPTIVDEDDISASESQPLVSGPRSRRSFFSKLKRLFRRRRLISSPTRASNGKRIFVPVRVEPKVFFANERTFLSWLHFSIFLGGIAAALLGLGHTSARISGYLFAAVSGIFAIYALYLYHWRAQKIRRRDPGPYDDLVGPTVLAIVFIIAMFINIFFLVP